MVRATTAGAALDRYTPVTVQNSVSPYQLPPAGVLGLLLRPEGRGKAPDKPSDEEKAQDNPTPMPAAGGDRARAVLKPALPRADSQPRQ